MSKLIMMRHGESAWNKRNLFTGWVDIPLSSKGIEEALEAGEKLRSQQIDVIFTSMLVRAQMTAFLVMSRNHSDKVPVVQHSGEEKLESWSKIHGEVTKSLTIPVIRSWELNERMYGDLQGLNKAETIEKFGPEQVTRWRRSYDIPPPNGESLEMTAERAIPYFKENVLPLLAAGQNVLISAHGNSLRAIIMDLENLTKHEVLHLELGTGVPIIYNYAQGLFSKETFN